MVTGAPFARLRYDPGFLSVLGVQNLVLHASAAARKQLAPAAQFFFTEMVPTSTGWPFHGTDDLPDNGVESWLVRFCRYTTSL